MSEKFRPYAAVYLILENKNKEILLSQRHNTGFKDGMWSLVAGHIDGNESVNAAMVREAKEEAGIEIIESDLEFVHLQHRSYHNREYLDIYFRCNKWKGTIKNEEPDKCSGLNFFNLESIPIETIDYVRDVLNYYKQGKALSCDGFDTEK